MLVDLTPEEVSFITRQREILILHGVLPDPDLERVNAPITEISTGATVNGSRHPYE